MVFTSIRKGCEAQAILKGILLLFSNFPSPSFAGRHRPSSGSLVAYWGAGQDAGVEGTLASACTSGNYDVVVLSFLAVFGNFQPPQLILGNHCDAYSNGCTHLSEDINICHNNGAKVFLSLGGAEGSYELTSASDAENLANYLWKNFFGGHSNSRPLGRAELDGVDLDIEGGSPLYYGNLAQSLKSKADGWHKELYLSSAPQCPFPDAYDGPGVGTALQTGLFDYVYVQFYNNYCEYEGDMNSFLDVWTHWSSALPHSKIFLGLPAAPEAANGGYLSSDVVVSQVLPAIKANCSNYGGVMLWSVYWDNTQSPRYSKSISNGL